MQSLSFLGISGSLRRQSRNSGLLRAAQSVLPAGVSMVMADLSEVPFYNADKASEPPDAIRGIFQMLQRADALVFACPEYNYSIAPALKNILDWASKEPSNTLLAGKPVAIMGAGGGMGTSRAQHHLRQVCVYLDLHPLNKPEVFSNAFSASFNDDGDLIDENITNIVKDQMAELMIWTRKLKHEMNM